MSRNTGAKHKLCRRAGEALCGSPKCPVHKRPYGPGQHGANRRRKQSEYGVQLLEKQKLRHVYGVQEKQFRKYYEEAARRAGITGDNLLQILETRLDNLVYRLGYSHTLDGARQLVNHRHVTVNGERVDIPSYHVKPGDVVALREKSLQIPVVRECLETKNAAPTYLEFDANASTGTLVRMPNRDEIPVNINETLIVEFYSR